MSDGTKASENFSWSEFFCPSSGSMILEDMVFEHISKLQKLREEFGPLKVNSGYRSPEHNATVGGAKKSMHLRFATDIPPVGWSRDPDDDQPPQVWLHNFFDNVEARAQELAFGGIGRYNTFIHLDCRTLIARPKARWDNRNE